MTRNRNKTLLIVAATTATTAILGGTALAGPALAADKANGTDSPNGGLKASPSESSSAPAPSPSTTPECVTVVGDAADVGGPGVGAVTVTLSVCAGKISSVSSALSESNFARNKKALVAMDKLALVHATTDINMISYSGATYTADSYRVSLESALAKAGLRPAPTAAGV